MEDGKPSQTALLVAMLRARHYMDEPEPKILRDSLAATLAGAPGEAHVHGYLDQIHTAFSGLSDAETATLFVRQLEHSVCIRQRLLEEELAIAKAAGATQLVVLGAGLDSTAYREFDLCDGLTVFEVDHPASQKWKQMRLVDSGVDIPDNVSYVPFDFENTTLADALEAGGVSRDEITVFSWMGVQMYLTDDAVKGTLAVMAGFPPGSFVVMDFIQPDYDTASKTEINSVEDLRKIVSKMSEPFKSQYSTQELAARFAKAGFSSSEFPTVGEFADRYLGGDKARLQMTPGAQYLAIGRV
ncbi:MAG: class I SAM-dependent methyltransferase [Hellea sp.]|nr:class I SAM-dependent methyltransferase [Hellea sp.]